ncbi:MAG: AAA family ATPase [Bacilli bacterium]
MKIPRPLLSCFKTWQYQEKTGYIFISKKYRNIWKDYSFKWPEQKQDLIDRYRLLSQSESDLYWCPMVFNKPRRLEEYTLPGNTLFADLDYVTPEECSIKPSVAWKSSTNRYQALWYLNQSLNQEEFQQINRKLTYSIGADKGGWDLTQVLRIPGTYNYKYSPPVKGQLLWFDQETLYNKETFLKLPNNPETGSSSEADTILSFIQLLSKHRKKINSKVSRLLQYPESRVERGKRSDTLWYIESELVKAEIPLEDIALLIKGSAWNKYRGRKDEMKRIMTEISKVYNDKVEESPILDDELEESEDLVHTLPWIDFQTVMAGVKSLPGWLVKDIWLRRSHGMIAGEPKTFKSTLSLDMAISVASGRPFLGKFPVGEVGPVMIIQNENADWIIKDRMEKILANRGIIGEVREVDKRLFKIKFAPELPIAFLNNYGYSFSDPLHRDALEQAIEQVKPVLVIFDPLYLMFEGEINSAKELNPVLQWLLELRNTYNTAIQLIHHWNKGGASSRGGQRMLGSTTLHGWNESALYTRFIGESQETENASKIIIEREYRAAGIMPKLEVDIQMGKMYDPLYVPKIQETFSKQSQVTDLMDLLSQYPKGLSIAQAAEELGISRRALTNLVDESRGRVSVVTGPKNRPRIKLKEVD